MQKTPKISFVCPSFNHEKYVKHFMESILAQTICDFELIIVDDCSNDNTISEIQKFHDERIKLIQHKFNMGINATLTDGIRQANSDLISIIASDDMLAPNYIEEVLKIFNEKNNDVLYVSLNLINENGVELNQQRIFDSNKTKYEYLYQSFMGENPLPSPGMVFKKSVIENFLPLPYGLFQYSDWDLNNKFLLNYKVEVSNKPLVNYRISSTSVSTRSQKVIEREENETDLLLDNFLSNCNLENFKNIFDGKLDEICKVDEKNLPYFISKLALKSKSLPFRKWGYKKIISLISNPEYFKYLNNEFNLIFSDVISLCPFEEHKDVLLLKKKVNKYKKVSNLLICLMILILLIAGVLICLIK